MDTMNETTSSSCRIHDYKRIRSQNSANRPENDCLRVSSFNQDGRVQRSPILHFCCLHMTKCWSTFLPQSNQVPSLVLLEPWTLSQEYSSLPDLTCNTSIRRQKSLCWLAICPGYATARCVLSSRVHLPLVVNFLPWNGESKPFLLTCLDVGLCLSVLMHGDIGICSQTAICIIISNPAK
jgi:hypothetical protein